MFSLPEIQSKGFSLRLDNSGLDPTVRFSGNGDTEAVAPLDRFLKLLHKGLVDEGAKEVSVDLGQLYFMNSSCLKAFVSWIYQVRTGGEPYHIRLQMNPRLNWQKRSLDRLVKLAPSVVILDELSSLSPAAAGAR